MMMSSPLAIEAYQKLEASRRRSDLVRRIVFDVLGLICLAVILSTVWSCAPAPCKDLRHWSVGDETTGASGTWCADK